MNGRGSRFPSFRVRACAKDPAAGEPRAPGGVRGVVAYESLVRDRYNAAIGTPGVLNPR